MAGNGSRGGSTRGTGGKAAPVAVKATAVQRNPWNRVERAARNYRDATTYFAVNERSGSGFSRISKLQSQANRTQQQDAELKALSRDWKRNTTRRETAHRALVKYGIGFPSGEYRRLTRVTKKAIAAASRQARGLS